MNTLTSGVMAELPELVELIKTDETIKGAVLTSGKASGFCAGADLGDMAGGMLAAAASLQDAFDAGWKMNGALRAHRDLRQAGRGRDQRSGAGRRSRTHARLPLPRRRRQPEDPARPARDQGRPVPGRRRHPAPAAPDRRAGGDDGHDRGQVLPSQRRQGRRHHP
jgi:hypothetical protein